mgnify:CR=1 FL=1
MIQGELKQLYSLFPARISGWHSGFPVRILPLKTLRVLQGFPVGSARQIGIGPLPQYFFYREEPIDSF